VLYQGGQPVKRDGGGRSEPLRTPAVVLGPRGQTVAYVARLDGVEPRQITVDGTSQGQVEVVMAVVADRQIAFPAPAQTGVGLGEGWLAVGLRGGKLGIARTDGTNARVVDLGGLRAVESTPFVQNARVFFVTNEGTVECVPLDSSVRKGSWPAALRSGAATELMVADGRVAVVDRSQVLHCWEQASGAHTWSVSLDSPASGPPTIDRRIVYVGTADGRVLMFDATDGRPRGVLTSKDPITTRVLCDNGTIWFGCADGNVRCVDVADGRVRWTFATGRNLGDGELAIGSQQVIAFNGKGELVFLDRQSGKQLGALHLDGTPMRGLRTQGQRAFVQLRRAKKKRGDLPTHDVIQAVHMEQMMLLWEHADEGVAPGLPGTDDFVVAVPRTTGEVVLFR
jgi:hypothetical protein